MNKFKPMLADDVDLKTLRYPVIASPKLDGVRATILGGIPLTRSLKPLANRAIAAAFSCPAPLDGELIVGDPTSKSVFRDTMKVVSAFEAPINDLRFHVFDMVTSDQFRDRLKAAHSMLKDTGVFVPVPHIEVVNEADLLRFEEQAVAEGFEGVMLRDPVGRYKFGRSTVREGALLKMKRRFQSEARAIEFVEQMHNANELKMDNLGYAERSSHQANMVPMDTLGAITVQDIHTNVVFSVGTGFDMATRSEIWRNKSKYQGKVLTYEYLPVGVKDKPRHPVFLGWRMESDL